MWLINDVLLLDASLLDQMPKTKVSRLLYLVRLVSSRFEWV